MGRSRRSWAFTGAVEVREPSTTVSSSPSNGCSSIPNFLFRVEREPAKPRRAPVYRISDLELASRLSFFLWSSIPDDELLDLAVRGRLKDPTVLDAAGPAHAGRSARSKALVENFAGQWLQLRNFAIVMPNRRTLSRVRREPARRVPAGDGVVHREHDARGSQRARALLTANYTFVNERLARHYEIPGYLRRALPAGHGRR